MSNTKDRVLLRYARDPGGRWFLWFGMSEPTWDGGEDFPKIEESMEIADVWVSVDNNEIQKALCKPELEATIEGRDGGG